MVTVRDEGGKYQVVGLQRPRHDPKVKNKGANPRANRSIGPRAE